MADTVFSRQLDAAQEAHALRMQRKPLVMGRAWWNVMLAAVLVVIAVWVYRSPLADVIDNSPVLNRAQDSLVSQFGGSLDQLVMQSQQAKMEQAAAAEEKSRQQAAAPSDDDSREQAAGTPDSTTTTTGAPSSGGNGSGSGPAVGAAPGSDNSRSNSAQISTGPSAPRVTDIPTKAALLQPTTKYFGVAIDQTPFSMASVAPFTAAVGKSPNMVGGYQTWDNSFNSFSANNAWRSGALPVYSWEPMKATETVTLNDIITGKYDEYITQYATDVKNNGSPIGIRFAHEMNGTWYPWSENEFGNQPGEFVAAWQHVHNVFDRVGASNVIWIWSPNVVGSNRDMQLSQLYPGDAYVDWAALSGYYRVDTGRTPDFGRTFDESLNAVRAVSTKPILLSEIGVGTSAENRVTWLNSLFAAIPNQPDVLGFIYFNYDATDKAGSKQDWRVDNIPEVTDAFRNGVANPAWGSGQ